MKEGRFFCFASFRSASLLYDNFRFRGFKNSASRAPARNAIFLSVFLSAFFFLSPIEREERGDLFLSLFSLLFFFSFSLFFLSSPFERDLFSFSSLSSLLLFFSSSFLLPTETVSLLFLFLYLLAFFLYICCLNRCR